MKKDYCTLNEFCNERHITRDSLNQFLYRRRKRIEKTGCTPEPLAKIDGRQILKYDSELYTELCERYPLPTKPIEIERSQELSDTLRELADAQKEIIRLQKQVNALSLTVSNAQKYKALLEYAENDKAEADAARDKAFQDRDLLVANAKKAEERARIAEETIDRMQKAGIIKRIFRKW